MQEEGGQEACLVRLAAWQHGRGSLQAARTPEWLALNACLSTPCHGSSAWLPLEQRCVTPQPPAPCCRTCEQHGAARAAGNACNLCNGHATISAGRLGGVVQHR